MYAIRSYYAAGPHANVSGFISATETGPNNTDTGYGTDTLTAILPPTIEKAFASKGIELMPKKQEITFSKTLQSGFMAPVESYNFV